MNLSIAWAIGEHVRKTYCLPGIEPVTPRFQLNHETQKVTEEKGAKTNLSILLMTNIVCEFK